MAKRSCKKAYRRGYREAQEEIKDLLSDVKDNIKAVEFLLANSSDISLDNLLGRLMSIRKDIIDFEGEEYGTSPVYLEEDDFDYDRPGRVRTILDFHEDDNSDVVGDIDIDTIGDEIFSEFVGRRRY